MVKNATLARTPKKEDLNFSATFTISHDSANKIKAHILKAINEIDSERKKGTKETVIQLNIDLFKWFSE